MIDEEKETEELTQENKEEIKEEKGEGISGLQEGIVAGISKDEFQV